AAGIDLGLRPEELHQQFARMAPSAVVSEVGKQLRRFARPELRQVRLLPLGPQPAEQLDPPDWIHPAFVPPAPEEPAAITRRSIRRPALGFLPYTGSSAAQVASAGRAIGRAVALSTRLTRPRPVLQSAATT